MIPHLWLIGTYRRDRLSWDGKEIMNYIAKCRLMLCGLMLAAISLALMGCGTPGETSTERFVRYGTIVRSNYGSMKSDIDTLLMMDKRSKLSKFPIRDY